MSMCVCSKASIIMQCMLYALYFLLDECVNWECNKDEGLALAINSPCHVIPIVRCQRKHSD